VTEGIPLLTVDEPLIDVAILEECTSFFLKMEWNCENMLNLVADIPLLSQN